MKFMQKSILGLFIGVGLTLTFLIVSKVFTSEIQPEAYRAENPGTNRHRPITSALFIKPTRRFAPVSAKAIN